MNLEQKIKELYKVRAYKSVKYNKIVTVLKMIVIDNETDLDKIETIADLKDVTMDKYMYDKILMSEYLDDNEYEFVLTKYKELKKIKFERASKDKYELLKNVIEDIMTTRYRFEQIAINNFITKEYLRDLLKDKAYLEKYFGEGIYEKIFKRIDETGRLGQAVPKNKYLVESKEDLQLLREDIHFLDEHDFRRLKIASSYLFSEGNVEELRKTQNLHYATILNAISSSKIKNILKDNVYQIVDKLAKIELGLNEPQVREHIIDEMIKELQNLNYNIALMISEHELPYYLVKRIITHYTVPFKYSKEVVENINMAIEKEEERFNKKVSHVK